MRRTISLLAVLLAILTTMQTAAAAPPQPLRFVLTPTGGDFVLSRVEPPDADPYDPTTWKHAHVDVTSTGTFTIEGLDSGVQPVDFAYSEQVQYNPQRGTSTDQGNVTLNFDVGAVEVRFVGRATVDVSQGFPPIVTVTDQPWTITGATGELTGLRGQGKRSTAGTSIVYEGNIHHAPAP